LPEDAVFLRQMSIELHAALATLGIECKGGS